MWLWARRKDAAFPPEELESNKPFPLYRFPEKKTGSFPPEEKTKVEKNHASVHARLESQTLAWQNIEARL